MKHMAQSGTVILLVAGCASSDVGTAVPARSDGLKGTSWKLVEFQSMDDAQGTTRPTNPENYTLSLGADGRASFKFDCNRGSGTWTSEPSSDGAGGGFTFGPVATTKMLCPPPSMGELVERQVGYIRSYMLKDGRLHFSLMADGGILVWEPANAPD